MHFYCVSILVCNSEFIRSTMTMKNVTRVIAESLMMHSSVRTWTLNGVCLIIIFIKFHSASFLLSTLIFCYHVPWPGFSSPPEYIGGGSSTTILVLCLLNSSISLLSNSTSVRRSTAVSRSTPVCIEGEVSCDWGDEPSLKWGERAKCKCGIERTMAGNP